MPKNWIEIKAKGAGSTKDQAVGLFVRAGSPGVLEGTSAPRDRIISHSLWAEGGPEGGFEQGRPKKTAEFTAYLDTDAAAIAALKKELKGLGWSFTSSPYKEQDWSTKWRAGLKTIRITAQGRTIVVRPTWRKAAKKAGEMVIEIDPGMAFGTGGHETTRMCLKAMLKLLPGTHGKPPKDGFLDVGTGTGVLAIAASRLGARRVAGIDIDPVAVKVARQNIRLNKAEVAVSAKPVEGVLGRYDIVAANILAGTLKALSAVIVKKVRPGGYLILSGILKDELKGVLALYEACAMKTVRCYGMGEWSCAVLQKETITP